MKRKDLKVGDELYFANPYEWDHNVVPDDDERFSRHDLGRVTVLAVEPYADRSGAWSRHTDYQPTARGNGVLVEKKGRRRVVQLAYLRGPWESTLAEVEARAKEDREASRQAEAERDARRDATTAVTRRAADAGFSVEPYTRHGEAQLLISAADLTRLLDRLDEARGDGRTHQDRT